MNTTSVKPIPEGMHTITPHLICDGAADAITFYKKAFNAQDLARLPGKDGKLVHALIRIGDSTVMLVDEFPEWGSSRRASIDRMSKADPCGLDKNKIRD